MKYILTPIFFVLILLIQVFYLIIEIIWKFKIKEPIVEFKKNILCDINFLFEKK